MGFNSTVVVRNDSLHDIEKDPEFGKKLSAAIMALNVREGGVDISACGFVNAATAIETHHADGMMIVAVGGNTARVLGYGGHDRVNDLGLIKSIADKMGYRLVKKTSRPR